jgi:hypothetical protein
MRPLLHGFCAAGQGGVVTAEQLAALDVTCPSIAKALLQYQGRPCPDTLAALLRQVLYKAEVGLRPQVLSEQQLKKKSASHARRPLGTMTAADLPPGHEPGNWTCDEAFLRTGTWTGGHAAPGEPWRPTDLGGNTVVRRVDNWAADNKSFGTSNDCVKRKLSSSSMNPGLLLGWCYCKDCNGRCVFMHLMTHAESPLTVLYALYAFWPTAPDSVCYDNGCHLHASAVNRAPGWFRHTLFLIDALHFKGHTGCCPDYSSGGYTAVVVIGLVERASCDSVFEKSPVLFVAVHASEALHSYVTCFELVPA